MRKDENYSTFVNLRSLHYRMGKCIYILIPWVLGFGTYVIKKKPDKNWDETAEDLFLLIFIEGVASFFVAVAVAFVSSV